MAVDERKIVIELKAVTQDTSEQSKNERQEQFVKKTVKEIGKVTLHEIEAQVDFNIDRYLTLSEDYKNAIRYSNAKTTINKVKSLGKNMIAMYTATTMLTGNVALGAVAAGITFAEEAISTGLELRRMYSEQSLQLATADRNVGYARSRLGLIDNGRGTYN